MKKFYVTTAIDYVNAAPHIGHAYEKIAADVIARYYRMRGYDVFFLTGTDEHGSKVEKSALAAGKTPIAFCDEIAETFKKSWLNLGLSFDYFIRTTEERHAKVVQSLFTKLKEQGDIYKSTYEGLYCEGCEDFLRERDLDESGNCPNHKKPPRKIAEENYFFKLSKYKPLIKAWLEENPESVRPDGRRKEVLNQLNDPELTDFSVSRSRKSLNWGIDIPGDHDQVIYVWMDALTNYITGAGYLTDDEHFQKYWPADLHLIGKDITKFHSIYWIAFLMAAGIPLPKQIYAHGFITVEGQKISKSLGNVIDPNKLVEEFGADAVRFFLMSGTSFDQDGDFSRHEFVRKVNAELANNLGNLLNRTLKLIENNLDGKIPDAKPEHDLREKANTLHAVFDSCMEKLEFAKAVEAIMAILDQTNKYINDEKPWTLFKEGKVKEASEVLYTSVEMLRRVAFQIYPFTPKLASDIWWQLGHDDNIEVLGDSDRPDGFFDMIPVGQKVRNTGPIFMRLEEAVKS
ncbi:MAG: methionine--tRNA ligase [Candidatus Melainabacteria bacterium]|jgi:methionyl-tRNA synthetase|nr:methionine--tRNA ligase [Candidatus Melainabacteria bacterium]